MKIERENAIRAETYQFVDLIVMEKMRPSYSNPNQHLTTTVVPKAKMTESKEVFEVSYKEATELFLAIEEMEWRDAFGIIESDPKQVQTWVNNSGTDDKQLDLNSWKRLPIHEACIRRAPAWLVSQLLSAFPESSSLTTNLDECPLHLAVDKQCAPEVVNLVIVANWSAIVATDHAGRTPLDIINHPELLEIELNQVIFESLKRCHKTYTEIEKEHREEKATLIRKQKAKSSAVSQLHQKEMKMERAKYANLRKEMDQLKKQIKILTESAGEKEIEIQKHIIAKKEYLETIKGLETKRDGLQLELENERAENKVLSFQIKQKEEEIKGKNKEIAVLSKDLQSIAISNETDVAESLMEAEQSMRVMVSSQIALQKLVGSKSEGLKTLLKHRGIEVPNVHEPPPEEPKDDKKVKFDDAEYVQEGEASAAMMAAAMAALRIKV